MTTLLLGACIGFATDGLPAVIRHNAKSQGIAHMQATRRRMRLTGKSPYSMVIGCPRCAAAPHDNRAIGQI